MKNVDLFYKPEYVLGYIIIEKLARYLPMLYIEIGYRPLGSWPQGF